MRWKTMTHSTQTPVSVTRYVVKFTLTRVVLSLMLLLLLLWLLSQPQAAMLPVAAG